MPAEREERLSYRKGSLCLSFDDPQLGSAVAAAYELDPLEEESFDRCRSCEVLIGGASAPYSLAIDGLPHAEGLEAPRVIGALDTVFEQRIRSCASEDVCSVHSFGLSVSGAAIALVGRSGAGKTTLGIAVASLGAGLLGDEFGFLDLRSGMYTHARYPFALKRASFDAALDGRGHFDESSVRVSSLLAVSPWGVESLVVPLEVARAQFGFSEEDCSPNRSEVDGWRLEAPLPLKAIVALDRFSAMSGCRNGCAGVFDGARLLPLPIVQFSEWLFPSIAAPGPRAKTLSNVVSALGNLKIRMLKLEYSDAREAATVLLSEFA